MRRWIWKLVFYVGAPLALVLALYGWWMKSRLDTRIDKAKNGPYSVASLRLVDPGEAEEETRWPRIVRLAVKGKDGVNWRPTPSGLVLGTYDWSPGKNEWKEVQPTLAEEAKSAKLRALSSIKLPGDLIASLSDRDPHVREAAAALLRARTGQDFGYRHDRPPATQAAAIEKWQAWWEANKVSWAAGKVVEGLKDIFK